MFSSRSGAFSKWSATWGYCNWSVVPVMEGPLDGMVDWVEALGNWVVVSGRGSYWRATILFFNGAGIELSLREPMVAVYLGKIERGA